MTIGLDTAYVFVSFQNFKLRWCAMCYNVSNIEEEHLNFDA